MTARGTFLTYRGGLTTSVHKSKADLANTRVEVRSPKAALRADGKSNSAERTFEVTAATPAAGASTVTSAMTNGTVTSADASGGAKQITVTYKGGKQVVFVPPTAPVVTVVPCAKSDVTVGTVVFINAVQQNGQAHCTRKLFSQSTSR